MSGTGRSIAGGSLARKRRCSAWCGRGCTEAEYQKAKAQAAALSTALGIGWRPVVWENLGWHAKAVHASGAASVYRSTDGYSALVGHVDGPRGGYWATRRTARMAVLAALLTLRADLRKLSRLEASARKVLG